MTVPQVNQYLTGLIGDGQSQTQQSVKPNNTALSATPQDGGALAAGFDRTASLQRHLNVNAQGSMIIGNTGGDAVTGDFDADADVAKTLIGLLTNSRLASYDSFSAGDWKRQSGGSLSAINSQAHTAGQGLFAISALLGRDTGDNTMRAVEANVGDTSAKFTKTLYGLLVNARLAATSIGSGDFTRLSADTPNSISSESHTLATWLRGAAAVFGRDTSDNTMRAVEAGSGTTASFASALYALLVNARMSAIDGSTSNYAQLHGELPSNVGGRSYSAVRGSYSIAVGAGVDAIALNTLKTIAALRINTTSANPGSLSVVEERGSGASKSLSGRYFAITTEGTAITATNGFTATTPRFTIEAGATNELLIRRIDISVLVAGTTNMQVRVVLDPDARYSSGGTAVTLGARTNMNVGSGGSATFTAHYGAITASATDADEREVHYGVMPNSTGGRYIIEFEDGLVCGASGTVLIYIMDTAAVGTAAINVYVEDVNVQ